MKRGDFIRVQRVSERYSRPAASGMSLAVLLNVTIRPRKQVEDYNRILLRYYVNGRVLEYSVSSHDVMGLRVSKCDLIDYAMTGILNSPFSPRKTTARERFFISKIQDEGCY